MREVFVEDQSKSMADGSENSEGAERQGLACAKLLQRLRPLDRVLLLQKKTLFRFGSLNGCGLFGNWIGTGAKLTSQIDVR